LIEGGAAPRIGDVVILVGPLTVPTHVSGRGVEADAWALGVRPVIVERTMSQTPPRAGVPVQDQSVLDRAVHLHRAGQLAEAQALYEQVLEADPDHAGAIHAIGLLTHQGGDSAGALRLLSRSIELEPGNADFHNNLGVVLKQLSRYEDAAAALRQAIALNGAHADAHLNLGDVLRKLGRDDEAERMQRRAEELRPIREMPLHEAMSMGMWLHRHGQLVEAQEVYDHILAAAPDHADALHFRGVLAHQLGEREQALELVRRTPRRSRTTWATC
jgi:Tfp pilus assembly protein PilF